MALYILRANMFVVDVQAVGVQGMSTGAWCLFAYSNCASFQGIPKTLSNALAYPGSRHRPQILRYYSVLCLIQWHGTVSPTSTPSSFSQKDFPAINPAAAVLVCSKLYGGLD